ncbi:MAG: chalcone isomerase family protein [Pseudomonadota bacterium]
MNAFFSRVWSRGLKLGFRFRLIGVLLVSGCFSNISVADDSAQTMSLSSQGTTLEPLQLTKVGEARLKVLLWSVYNSRLFTENGEYEDGDRPLRLEIEYLRDIKSEALIKRTRQEWEAMGREHPRQEDWLGTLASIWPDIETDDVLTLELREDNVAYFLRNGDQLGQIDDPAFGQQFIDIWLSQDCTRPELRLTLLGLDG